MFQKWKLIINNWMNCYFNNGNKHEECVNFESLLKVISYLRENYNLDESISSLLGAHTIEEFIKEKYPSFKFANGTVIASNEDEIYLVASLLLFFVCVNSKDVNIKNAMCSRLSPEDQEIILRFSKSLMECSPVTCKDVQAAITDACGLDVATTETSHVLVAETPPALRSLHSEVRRLQAALDAERFDRNYLQEELSRTNMRIEKLLKDKEQYNLEILHLKAKISMCCGQEEIRSTESQMDMSARLRKQLQEMEERLVCAVEKLDDVTYERNTLKAKMDELKQDRDKWFFQSQQESTHAAELSEELETERRHVHSLRELVSELRQHNRRNGLDTSQLECDDPDTSTQSILHNLSNCSEACANVVEVQLAEERAKTVVLNQQIQNLQDQINELTQKLESEKQKCEKKISDKENNIFNLKHRINEEIEEKNILKANFNDEISKLNNKNNEIEQKYKDNTEKVREVINQKMQEIQTLQEEKLSLLQIFSNETTKLENIIQNIKMDIDNEKQAKSNMKDSYENHIMKLNEKILNRNNELVELQNNIFEKSEMIESLHIDLKKEREHKEQLTSKYHEDISHINKVKIQLECDLQKKTEEMINMQQNFEQNISALINELDNFKSMTSELLHKCHDLEETKEKLQDEITNNAFKLDKFEKEIENTKNLFREEREKLKHDLDVNSATISTLQNHLQEEIDLKIGLQEELQTLRVLKTTLSEEVAILNSSLVKVKTQLSEKDRSMTALDICLQKEKSTNEMLNVANTKLSEQLKITSQDIIEKNNNIEHLSNEFETVKNDMKTEIHTKENMIQELEKKISSEVVEKGLIEKKLLIISNEMGNLEKALVESCQEKSRLQAECNNLYQNIENNMKIIEKLKDNINKEQQKFKQLEQNFESETSKIFLKLNKTEKTINELSTNSKKALTIKEQEIRSLNDEIDRFKNDIESNNQNISLLLKEKEVLQEKLKDEIMYKNKFEIEYQNKCKHLVDVTTQLNKEIGQKNDKIIILKQELQEVAQINQQKYEEIQVLQKKLSQEINTGRELLYQKEIKIKELQIKLNDQESLNDELELELKKAVDNRQQTEEALQKENEQLHFEIEEDNINHEVITKEKDKVIDKLEQDLKWQNIQIESIRKDYEDITLTWEKFKMETHKSISSKEDHINKLCNDIICIKNNLVRKDNAKNNLLKKIENIAIQKNEMEQTYRDEISKLLESLQLGENKYVVVALEKHNIEKHLLELKVAKEFLETEKVEMSKTINTLIADNNKLTNEITILQQQLLEEKSVREITAEEKELIKHKFATEKVMIKTLLEEKACLTQQIVEEKLTKEILEKENKLSKENLAKQVSMVNELLEEKKIMTQELVEEKTAKDLIEKEKEITENKLMKEISMVNILLEEKECLAQQLIEEKSAKDLTEKEKEIILTEKDVLEQKFCDELSIKEVLQYEIQKMNKNQEILEQRYDNDKLKLLQELTVEKATKDAMLKNNESLVAEKETLSFELTERKAIQEVLMSDKQLLIDEKEALVKSLTEEKAFYDEIENEKVELSKTLNGLNENYSKDIKEKQIELDNIKQGMKHLEVDCLNQAALNKELSTTLSDGLNKLIQVLEKEDICIDVLEKLIEVDHCDIPVKNKCDMLINFANTLTNELALKNNLEKTHENVIITELREVVQQKEVHVLELETEVKRLQQVAKESTIELSKQAETHTTALDTMSRQMESLKRENQSLTNDLNDVKLQLEVKVHSLKEKLIDNENLTDKLKRTYETQIDNLNIMITKLTSYLKDKTIEIETARKEKEMLQQVIENNNEAINYLEDKLKTEKQNEEKLISDFESERCILKNMVIVTESVMEDQKVALNKVISEHLKNNEALQEEIEAMKLKMDNERKKIETKVQEKDNALESIFKELAEERFKSEQAVDEADSNKVAFSAEVTKLNDELSGVLNQLKILEAENEDLTIALNNSKDSLQVLELEYDHFKIEKVAVEKKLQNEIHELKQGLECSLKEKTQNILELQEKVELLTEQINVSAKEKSKLEEEKHDLIKKLNESQSKLDSSVLKDNEELTRLKNDNMHLVNINEENKTTIRNLELLIKHEVEQNQQLRKDTGDEKLFLVNKCSLLQDHQTKAEKELEDRQTEIISLQKEINRLQDRLEICEEDLKAKDDFILKISKDKDTVINTINKELLEEKSTNEKYQKEIDDKNNTIGELRKTLNDLNNEREALQILKKENEELIKAITQRETIAVIEKASSQKNSIEAEKEHRDLHHQVDNISSDITQSSLESLKTISDLEKIIHDRNRTITTLQSDVTYLKSLMAESETKLLDVSKELEVSNENYQQLSCQLKKIVQQKNEEIAELKKQVSKMSVTENRATQIIKVSAKYQAIILKRIAEIKTNTVLKELTNYGNSNNCDNELRRSLSAGAITMEELENFLETTDRHLKRCSEKQVALQKERDRLAEVNRINESEIINLKKFLTELSMSYQTFTSVKDLYSQKLIRVISVQRTVRREILNMEGRITDACMFKLERGYAAVMQDLSECAMNLQRWVERCIGRTISPEKLKQAFMNDVERPSLTPTNYQNVGLEVQLEELDKSFHKLLEEVTFAQKGEGAKDVQAVTVMEVRAEYEDKLNRMKAKMKQLYIEQIAVFKEKQKEEISLLERELQKARDKLAESSSAYEEHIRALTTELWSVGEKFLMKKDEAEWLRRKQNSGSLMSLQHVHSSGLVPPQQDQSRPSDTYSLRSLPVNNNTTNKREGRGMHMSDEEGEVFDNRCLVELSATPRRAGDRGQRLSELQWRNSLCPPHLKSSYPAETQFTPAINEEVIKCTANVGVPGVRQQRKEVGITAYKKPGPPTPSKQAGRLSATDSELRESLRVEADPQPSRKTSTPSRIRALFRSSRNDTAEGTPRSKRLSHIFRKK